LSTIITSSVLITLGAAEQITAGIDVPGAVSLIGYGDAAWQRWWGPGLTTQRLPIEELANGADCGYFIT
jgi:LacI family transcriptional regulator